MKTTLDSRDLKRLLEELHPANARFAARYPGESAERQPVHTVYGGAHLFRAKTAARLGERALASLDEYVPDAAAILETFAPDLDDAQLARVHERVRQKLEHEPVEDFRLDFEDGYGHRPDAEEDACAVSAADEVARGHADGTLPAFIGIRVKPVSDELVNRSLRTLDLFVTRLVEGTDGVLPPGFAITLPKVVSVRQVTTFVDAVRILETRLGLPRRSVPLELMIETTQSILDPDGRCIIPALVDACRGRCRGAHFGVYDYTASCSITAQHQAMRHPACDMARHMMQIALAGTGIMLSDGATNVMPVPLHRASDGDSLTAEQVAENVTAVRRAMRMHYEDTRHSLRHGYYQGWDLHPAQLVPRYVAVHAFFLEGLDSASERLRNFVEKAAQATLVGDVFDDAATGQGLLNFFLRGISCGAITDEEALATGLSMDELRSRSFKKILDGRRG